LRLLLSGNPPTIHRQHAAAKRRPVEREGADRHGTRFNDRLQAERALCLELTMELLKEADVLATMRAAILTAAAKYGLHGAMRWIHGQRLAMSESWDLASGAKWFLICRLVAKCYLFTCQ
jgi:hypothetical protein